MRISNVCLLNEIINFLPGVDLDPWACTTPPDRHYTCRWVDGVMVLYRTAADAEAGRSLPYQTLPFQQFVEDMSRLMDMISDGPLLVHHRTVLLGKDC